MVIIGCFQATCRLTCNESNLQSATSLTSDLRRPLFRPEKAQLLEIQQPVSCMRLIHPNKKGVVTFVNVFNRLQEYIYSDQLRQISV